MDDRDFHHPYEPYRIQLDLMNALYDCIQNRQIGIFESPTGTGKSLSLLCASLTWLRDHQLHGHVEAEDGEDTDEPEWIVEQTRTERKNEFSARKERIARHLATVREKEAAQKKRYQVGGPPRKKFKKDPGIENPSEATEEASFLIEDYESDPEISNRDRSRNGAADGISAQTLDVLKQLGMAPLGAEEEQVRFFEEGTKIFYCSRTHSQLSQLAAEVHKLKFPVTAIEKNDQGEAALEEVKYLTLGSRKNLCINPKMQQSKNDSEGKCVYLPKPETEPLVHDFRDHALAKVRDIEDLAHLGKTLDICPYYASRAAIKPSELVTLPYPLLLQKAARETLDLSLKDHIVIIDEAHNLIDAIAGIYSAEVTLSQLKLSRSQLGVYLQKFRNKVKGKNRVYLAQIIRVIDALISRLTERSSNSQSATTTVPELLGANGADQIDLFKLSVYLHESHLARKVDGYVEFTAQSSDMSTKKMTMPVLSQIESFLLALMNPSTEGKFFYERSEGDEPELKYLLLDPAFHFRDIVQEARSVILIGGTMSPMDEFIHQLFPYAPKERIRTLSCDHIIPDSNLLAWPISCGIDAADLEFTFERRSKQGTLNSLGKSLVALARVVPHGLVVFFPSYSYLEQSVKSWKSSANDIWAQLSACKEVFTDSKESAKVDDILSTYSEAVHRGNGAILLSVVGGKMSEGINFSDELGRGVVIIGLPFPNANGIEWKTKMAYIQQHTISRGGSPAEGAAAARSAYENACMRAVNQSIGRAIRHRKDFASIFMVDRRYANPRIHEKLPGWIRSRVAKQVAAAADFQDMLDRTKHFFKRERK